MKDPNLKNKKIVFFDGVCNLCNSFVNHVISKDAQHIIFYSSLQSEKTAELLAPFNVTVNEQNLSTIYFYENGALYQQSTAVLKVYKNLGGGYKLVGNILMVIPVSLRNFIYNFFARNRYRFFGRKETCRLPSKEEKDQFV
jgi:predicted DCC family thiol-disulfide oxidoreductase YuxK